MKYIDADRLKAELERQKHELKLSIQSQGDYGQSCHIVAYENILSFIGLLPEEPSENIGQLNELPTSAKHYEDLEKAADYSWAEYEYRETPQGLYSSCYIDGFKAGANWQKEQILALIEERIMQLQGDAQPNPILRIELRDLIKLIKR